MFILLKRFLLVHRVSWDASRNSGKILVIISEVHAGTSPSVPPGVPSENPLQVFSGIPLRVPSGYPEGVPSRILQSVPSRIPLFKDSIF